MHTAICEKVGAWLLKPGNTKTSMASELGITYKTLTAKLNGEQPWLFDEVCQIADIIGCSVLDLRDKAA